MVLFHFDCCIIDVTTNFIVSGKISHNQTTQLLAIITDMASSSPSVDSTVKLAQVLASVAIISPSFIYSTQFLDCLDLIATLPSNSDSSRDVCYYSS